MKCEKCGNEYPTPYYFQTQTVCRDCFNKMTPEEQQSLSSLFLSYTSVNPMDKRIGFLKRFAAGLIDVVIVFGLSLIIQMLTGYNEAANEMQLALKDAGQDTALIMQVVTEFFSAQRNNLLLSTIVPMLYLSMEIFNGAAVGKILLKLKIGGDDMAKPITSSLITRYLIKNITYLVAIIIIFSKSPIGFAIVGLIGILSFGSYLFVLGQKRQTIHDMIAGTAVYNKDEIISE
jgi:uncharacterized RDD family membrane protein YckC